MMLQPATYFFFPKIYLFLIMLRLSCCTSVFSKCRDPGLLIAEHGLLNSGYSFCRSQALGRVGFSSCGTWA